MDFVFIYRGVFYLWVGFGFLSVLIPIYCAQRLEKEGRDEQLGAMQRRKKMALFPVRNTHDLVWTTCGKDGMLPFHLASSALVKLCIMYRLTEA